MTLDDVWFSFFSHFTRNKLIEQVEKKEISHVPFLYITSSKGDRHQIEKWIHIASETATTNAKVTWQTEFVRHATSIYVYRHRFFVPQRKSFCCGNVCGTDCTRLRL
ncbi:hypothetical protein [Priestia flexa]|uniref:hypothetical protein n=1 Tax=Priestia flexa TaxID=86664 RepID=UPI003D08A0DB